MAFTSLLDIKHRLEKKSDIEIDFFDGWKLETNVGKFLLEGNTLFKNGSPMDSKQFEKFLKELK
jgi:hypothetical protein